MTFYYLYWCRFVFQATKPAGINPNKYCSLSKPLKISTAFGKEIYKRTKYIDMFSFFKWKVVFNGMMLHDQIIDKKYDHQLDMQNVKRSINLSI